MLTRRRIKRLTPAALDPARPLPLGLDWYVLTTEPRRESHVARWLEEGEGGFHTLVPLETRWRLMDKRRGGGRPARVRYQVPLIPRVVIVGCAGPFRFDFDAMDNFYVTGVLGIGGIPCPMRRGEAERLQAGSERLRKSVEPKPLKVGGKAVLTHPGLLQGRVVEVASLTGKRATVIQRWFGSPREVTVRQDDLEAV